MNSVCLIGRLARDPDVRYAQNGNQQICVARYTLAVDRVGAKEGQQQADFIQCCAFGKTGEFVEKYLRKGMKVGVKGKIQTGSYTNKDGAKVYTFEVIAEQHDFCEKRGDSAGYAQQDPPQESGPVFVNVPDNIDDEGLPFN